MAKNGFESPKVRNIAIGVGITVVALMIICSLGEVVKMLGAVLLFLPSRIGLVQMVTSPEVKAIDISTSPSAINFTQPGNYALYTNDYDLLVLSDDLYQSHAAPWVTVKGTDGGNPIPVILTGRGLAPYDTPLAKGRPVLSFRIPAPGNYEFVHTRRPLTIWIVPDYVTGSEGAIITAYIVQIAILFALAWIFYRWRTRGHTERIRQLEDLRFNRRKEYDRFRQVLRRTRKEAKPPDQPTYWQPK